MKFGLYLEENLIPEWREFYLNFELLKKKIKPFKKKYKQKSEIKIKSRNSKHWIAII
jgi:SPX domain protein involved in polyphosphate accumulation